MFIGHQACGRLPSVLGPGAGMWLDIDSGEAALVSFLRMLRSRCFPLPLPVSERAGVLHMNPWLPLLGYQQEALPVVRAQCLQPVSLGDGF